MHPRIKKKKNVLIGRPEHNSCLRSTNIVTNKKIVGYRCVEEIITYSRHVFKNTKIES